MPDNIKLAAVSPKINCICSEKPTGEDLNSQSWAFYNK